MSPRQPLPNQLLFRQREQKFLRLFSRKMKRKLTECNDDDDDNGIKPIGYEVNKPTEPKKKERIGDTSVNKKVTSSEEKVQERKLGPTIPDHIKEAIEKTENSI